MSQPATDLRTKTLHSLIWQFMGVGGQQVMTLISMRIISRTIDKPDVGLFAILVAGIGMVEALTVFAGEQSTIASPRGADRRYLDTVFTVRLLRGVVVAGLLCALAPALAWYFHDNETEDRYWLTGLFLAMSPNVFFDGLQSPARAARLKSMAFRRVVLCDFVAFLVGMIVTITLVLTQKDVWALLIGYVATTALRTALSYVAAPHVPRLVLDKDALRDLFEYSKGATGSPFLLFVTFAASPFILGRLSKEIVAIFEYAGKLARLPETIFLRVLGPVAVPAYAQLRDNVPQLARAWLGAMQAFLLVGGPLTVGMSWCGGALPAFAFENSYGEIDSLFVLQCVYGGLAGLTSVVGPLFWAIGQPHRDRRAQFARCIVVYALGIPFALTWGAVGFAVASCVSIFVALFWCIVQARQILGLTFGDVFSAMRPGAIVAGSLAAALFVVDLVAAPTGPARLIASAALSGPLLGIIVLRMLRKRGPTPSPNLPSVDAAS